MKLIKIKYKNLNTKQKESYNYQKISAVLADYGFTTIKLDDDWQNADFIAKHINGDDFVKIQLKSRLCFYKKYLNKNLYICFRDKNDWYLYNHDELLEKVSGLHKFSNSKSWKDKDGYSFSGLKPELRKLLNDYKINT